MGELTTDEEQRWVCPNDRQLSLRAKLNSGWSFHSSGPARKTSTKADISITEQEVIRNVLERSEKIRQVEEERIGRLVEKLENMCNNAIGDGKESCLLCNSKFGALKVVAKRCDICGKCVCEKCGLDTQDSHGDFIWLCMLCSEQRELWKRTGAWFFNAMPKYTYPGRQTRSSAERNDTSGSNNSDQLILPQSNRYNRTWTTYSKSKDYVDGDVREESQSDDEESSSSSDEMIFDHHSKKSLHSTSRDRLSTTEEPSSTSLVTGRVSDTSMPGSDIWENIDTPPPFRKRTLQMTQDVKESRPSNLSQNTSSLEVTNGKLSPDGGHKRAESPKVEKSGSFSGKVTEEEIKVEVNKALIRKQETVEEEDIDELVRTFKESEASIPKDSGDAGLGTIEFSVHYEKQHSRLQVTIECAQGLKAMDHSGTSDPYVKLHLLPGASKSNKLRTHTKYKTLNPIFDETLVYHGITDDDMSKKSLRLQVFDEDRLSHNNFIGETCVALKVFHSKPSQSLKRSLISKASFEDGRVESPEPNLGRLQLSLKYKSQKSELVVGIIRCAGLAAMDSNGYSDPYVKCYLKPDVHKKSKRRTSVKKKTLNPEYNEEFVYEMSHHELAKKSLELTVWDYDVGKSNDFIGGIAMDINSSGSALMHWYGMLKTPDQVHTHWHTLEKLTNHEQE